MRSSIALCVQVLMLAPPAGADTGPTDVRQTPPYATTEAQASPARPMLCQGLPILAKTGSKTLAGNYVTIKHLVFLNEPLISTGRIVFADPDRLAMTTISPTRQTLTVSDGRMRIVQHDFDKTQEMSLKENEVAAAIVSNIVNVLAGRFDLLERFYECGAVEVGPGVSLQLTPKDKEIRSVINKLLVTINLDGEILSVHIDEINGDTSDMVFSGVVRNKALTVEDLNHFKQ